jgi:hypothetical protein
MDMMELEVGHQVGPLLGEPVQHTARELRPFRIRSKIDIYGILYVMEYFILL